MVRKAVALLVLFPFLLLTHVSCGGGGGGGSSSPEEQTMAAFKDLDDDFYDGRIDDDVFAIRLDGIIAKVEARTNGLAKLNTHIMENVLGEAVFGRGPVAAKTPQEAIDYVTGTNAWLSFKAFMDVAASAMMPEPVAIAKDFADPEVFLAFSAVTIIGQIKKANTDGLIDVLTAQELYEIARKNPWEARAALDVALGRIPAAATQAVADAGCLRGCDPFSGQSTTFVGPFSASRNTSGGGCTWQDTLSGTITLTVMGAGTSSDPFDGTFDVQGTLTEVLVSGADCDPGFSADIDDTFEGEISSSGGKLYAEGVGSVTGTSGSLPFMADITAATVTSESVTGEFQIILDAVAFTDVVVLSAD